MFEAGKRYMIIREDKNGIKRFPGVVNWCEDRGDHWYIGYTPDDFRICRWGVVKIKKQGLYKAINYRFEAI